MNLRFLKKKDGTQILQQRAGEVSKWKDIPMVDEKFIGDEIAVSIATWKARGVDPKSIALNPLDFEDLTREFPLSSVSLGVRSCNFMGFSVITSPHIEIGKVGIVIEN